MKKVVLAVLMLTFALFALTAAGSPENKSGEKTYLIGVSKIMAHPALDQIEQGIQDYLATTDLKVTYDFQNCNGDVGTAALIAQLFKEKNADIVVGIATPPAQALANTFGGSSVPVVFSAISDPVAAGFTDAHNKSLMPNICGISDKNPIKVQLDTFIKATGVKTIGMVYCSGEANGVSQMEEAGQACAELGVELVTAAVSNSAEVMTALLSIIERVDGVYVAIDNTVVSAIASVDQVCTQYAKPLFNTDTTSSEGTGFFMSWSFRYYTVGYETGRQIEKILTGQASPESIGAVYFDNPAQFELVFNLDSAARLGLTIPDDILKSATFVVKDGKTIDNPYK
ncbi:MAG: ABC transporter substrate-binding protein [Spirochaetales bacterium]|nr:ABC transporter substrate-binding protein [Spirochaetales bacterium]